MRGLEDVAGGRGAVAAEGLAGVVGLWCGLGGGVGRGRGASTHVLHAGGLGGVDDVAVLLLHARGVVGDVARDEEELLHAEEGGGEGAGLVVVGVAEVGAGELGGEGGAGGGRGGGEGEGGGGDEGEEGAHDGGSEVACCAGDEVGDWAGSCLWGGHLDEVLGFRFRVGGGCD